MKTIYINKKGELTERKIKKIAKKVYKASKKESVVVALCNSLCKNEELIQELESYRIEILNRRWLFKFLLCDILEYLAKDEGKPLETLNISILINSVEEVVNSQIIKIAKMVKTLKIVTHNVNKFIYLEENLYNDFGIAIQVTNNKEKALINAEIILNLDFNDDKISEYNINSSAKIVNIKREIKTLGSNFRGRLINNYKIGYNEELLEVFKEKNEFDSNILYESLIYRKDTFEHIRKQLEIDGVKLLSLI